MSRAAPSRAPLVLVVAAGIVVGLLLLPLAYLVIRVAGGGRALEVLGEAATWRLVWNTFVLAVGVVTATIVVGVPLAWLVTSTDLPGRRVWATAGALPLVIPSYVAAFCLLGFFGARGLFGDALGVERMPEIKGYWGSLAALTLATYPYVFLLTQSALRSLDPSLEEAARGLGVSGRRMLLRVTAPAIRSAVGLGALLVALYTFSDFGVVSLMDYDTLTRAIYVQYKSLFDRAPAATLALLLVALTGVALVIEYRTRQSGRVYRSGPGTQRQPAPVRLGRWTAPALVFCSAVVGLFLVLPAGVLGYWLARGIENDRTFDVPWSQAVNSLDGLWPRGSRRGRRRDSCRGSRAPVPVTNLAHVGTLLVRGQCASGARHRPIAGVLRRPLRVPDLPDARASRVRVRRALLPSGALGCRVGARARQSPIRRGCARPRAWTASDNGGRDRAARPLRRPRGRSPGLPVRDEGAAGDASPAPDRFRDLGDGNLGTDSGRRVFTGGGSRTPADRRVRTRAVPRLLGTQVRVERLRVDFR